LRLQFAVLFLIGAELLFNCFKKQKPLFLKHVVLFKLCSYVTLVFFVMRRNLRLAFLEHFDFESALAWPLLSKVLIKLLN
jgi:hypothetical protein